MTQQRIMYVCSECADSNPEGCGQYDRNDLRLMPDGRWLCEACFDDTSHNERTADPETDEFKNWSDMPTPPQYAIQPQRTPDRERGSDMDGLSEHQRKLDASVSEQQAREYVRKERERNANRDKPIPAPRDGFINDYD